MQAKADILTIGGRRTGGKRFAGPASSSRRASSAATTCSPEYAWPSPRSPPAQGPAATTA